MRCEVVAIGTELLLGIIVDSNSAWIGEQLALAGIDSYFQVKVGDNFARIEATIRQALERSDAVICCGGLGPTQDDITRDVIARIMGVKMRRDEEIAERIRKFFEARAVDRLRAETALAHIGRLYAVERHLQAQGDGAWRELPRAERYARMAATRPCASRMSRP